MYNKQRLSKSVCVLVTFMLIASAVVVLPAGGKVNNAGNKKQDNPNEGVPLLSVEGVWSDDSVVYLGEENKMWISISNEGNGSSKKTIANVTDIKPDGSEELINSLHFGNMLPGKDQKRPFHWYPEGRGIHYLKVDVEGEYIEHHSKPEEVSTSTILSSAFPVNPTYSNEAIWDPGHEVTGYEYYSDYLITMRNGDLTITDTGHLEFGPNVAFVIENPDIEPHKYGINIDTDGKFTVDGWDSANKQQTVSIQTSTDTSKYNTYPFINHGTVDFDGADVTYTYGDKNDLTKPGGIQNKDGSTCNLNNCSLVSADTHGVYIGKGVSSSIKGKETIVGSDVDPYSSNVQSGHGILVEESNPDINNVSVKYNQRSGISCVNTTTPIIKHNIVSFNDMHGIDLERADAQISEISIHDNGGNGINCIDGSAPTLSGSATEISWNEGNGIFADCSHPKVDGITVERNRAEGVNNLQRNYY